MKGVCVVCVVVVLCVHVDCVYVCARTFWFRKLVVILIRAVDL